MKNFFTAFFMAWGNFLSIPCPIKKWDDNLKKAMLTKLPFVGLVCGLLWFAVGCVLLEVPVLNKLPSILTAFFLTWLIYKVTGYLHLDGFMDCRDAIMSRRSLDEKQRILKDSHVGAFAVISVVLLILGMFVGIYALLTGIKGIETANLSRPEAEREPLWVYLLPLISIPITSRTVAGKNVLVQEPMPSSQYANLNGGSGDSAEDDEYSDRYSWKILFMALAADIMVILVFIVGSLGIAKADIMRMLPGEPLRFFTPLMIRIIFAIFMSYATTVFSTEMAISRARKNLGGMNGDIAGYGICIGEVVGVITAAIMLIIFA